MNKALVAAAQRTRPGHSHAMHWLVHLGPVGLFGIALLDACPVPLPVPGATDLLLLILVARKGNPWLLVPLAVGGAVVGALTAWSADKKGGEPAMRRYVPKRYYGRMIGWVRRHGTTVVALSAINPPPIPLMPFLVAAGALGVGRGRFLAAFTAARASRYALVAWLGIRYGRHMIRWWNLYLADYSGVIAWGIFAIFLAAFLWGLWKWRRNKMQHAPQPAHS